MIIVIRSIGQLMTFKNISIKHKILFLISGAGLIFAIVAGALFTYNERSYLIDIQRQDEQFANFAYHQIYSRQEITNTIILNSLINTPGFSEAFVKRDRKKIIQLWANQWNTIHEQNIDILHLHEANGKSFIRMHEHEHYGDTIGFERPMISYVHNMHRPISGFEVGIYGLAYRVAIPVIINGRYEGAIEIGSDPQQFIQEIHDSIGVSGFILINPNPLMKTDIYTKKIGHSWVHSYVGFSPIMYDVLKKLDLKNESFYDLTVSYHYLATKMRLTNFQHKEIAKVIFIRDNTTKAYSSYFKIFIYGLVALGLLSILLLLINRWIGNLLDQLEHSNQNLSSTLNELHRYQSVLDQHNIVSKSDLHGVITYVNDNFCQTSGYTREELIGKPHSIIRHPDTPKETFEGLWNNLHNKQRWMGLLKNRKKDGTPYYIDTLIVPFTDEKGNVIEYIAVRHDITELIQHREELQHLATTDTLTQLGNRLSLLNDINTANTPCLALIDVDRFGEINDFYGQTTGDQVLIEISQILRSISESKVKHYRLGSDTFALMADNMEREMFLSLVNETSNAISKQPLVINLKSIPIQVTVGISFEQPIRLLQTADMALNIGKKEKNHNVIFREELSLENEYANNIYWTLKIKNALEHDRITCHYQPIVNNTTGKIEKYESLVRLIDDDGKIISPYAFLDIAKKSKQYIDITKRVIKNSFESFDGKDISFSINFTLEDILSEELNHYLQTMLEQYDVKGRLVIELVESEGIENYEQVVNFISEAKNCGCKIAIDDFGTGYSNFEYLLRLKPDFIKIDGSMIRTINENVSSMEVVRTIIDFAQRTGIKTIGEFVCDESVSNTVITLGIDYSQGYFHGKPKSSLSEV